ncbi:GRIP and coiled-coil domain-containing protein 1 [Candoia aspera]|uniref:GRIP and coiled-coil domain-containing protein 1 n=1 Tax=Candoia aspera TaxID=51853 RepID=UPI002FD7DEC5
MAAVGLVQIIRDLTRDSGLTPDLIGLVNWTGGYLTSECYGDGVSVLGSSLGKKQAARPLPLARRRPARAVTLLLLTPHPRGAVAVQDRGARPAALPLPGTALPPFPRRSGGPGAPHPGAGHPRPLERAGQMLRPPTRPGQWLSFPPGAPRVQGAVPRRRARARRHSSGPAGDAAPAMEAPGAGAGRDPSRQELLETVAAQEEQLREYRARLRDLVHAHKGLLAERAALEAGLGALAAAAAAEGEAAVAAAAAAAAGGPEARLGAALATLAREKARLEACCQAERRGARAERARLEDEAREARARLAAQQHDRAQEQADHADMLRELQRLLQDERARRREAELGLEEARRAEPRPQELQAELDHLRSHFQAQLLQEAGKAAEADEHIRMGERRVAALEAQISEMSELLGTYEKAKQKDLAIIQKLKDRIVQLDLENKTLAVAATGNAAMDLVLEESRDINVLRDKMETLTQLARAAAEHGPSSTRDVEALCPAEPPKGVESGDGEKATVAYYQQELKQLKEEFERYKVRAQVVLKNKSAKDGNLSKELADSQEQLAELKEKYVSLRLSCEEEARQHREQLEVRRREVALLQQLHRQELERCLLDSQEKALRLEEEMRKQRDRALAVVAEKDQELQQLRALAMPYGLQGAKAAAELGPSGSGNGSAHSSNGVGDNSLEHLTQTLLLPAPIEPPFLLYTEQLARKEAEITALKKQKHRLEMEVHRFQEKLLEEGEKHKEEMSLLQGHVQKTFRDQSREGANLEYLKNIFYRFLTLTDLLGRQQTLTAILTILHFSPEERQAVLSRVGGGSSWWLSGKR